MSLGRALRASAYHWHGMIARSEQTTRAYVRAVAAVARHLPRGPRGMLEWAVTGQNVPWKPLAFAPRTVIAGRRTAIRLTPHLGEFDQAALFSGRLMHDADILSWLEQHASKRYDAVIDIGANVGLYAIFLDALIRQSPAGRLTAVYAFEPSPEVFARLLANMAANHTRSITPFAVAVSDASGFVAFHQPEGRLTNGSLSPAFAEQFAGPTKRQTVATLAASSLASLFERHERILLKIDVEGFEPTLLAALASLLARHRPDIMIEVLPGVDAKLDALACLAGYTRFHFAGGQPERRDRLAADPAHRDWLLTTTPHEIEAATA